jgi:hypothetical protein
MGSYQQVQAGTPLTVTETFSVDGAPIDVDSGLPTLALTRPDGTVYTPVPTVSHVGALNSGQYRFVLPKQPDPYWLDYKLTGVIGGQSVDLGGRVEWVGTFGHLFNLDEFRALRVGGQQPFSATATPLFSAAQIQDVRAQILDEMTDILGFSPIPRFYRETVSAVTWANVVTAELLPSRLLTVTVNGATSAPSGYYLGPGGTVTPRSVYTPIPWTAYGIGNVNLEYVAGWDRLRGRGGNRAQMWAAAELIPSLYSSAQTVTTADGETISYEPSETGRNGFQRFTGIRAVDRWLNLHRQPVPSNA